MRKIISIVLVIAMLTGLIPVVSAESNNAWKTEMPSTLNVDAEYIEANSETLFNGENVVEDPVIREAINSAYRREGDKVNLPVTKEMLKHLLVLSPEKCLPHNPGEDAHKSKSLKGIEFAENLEYISLPYQPIADFSPISNLTKVKYINITSNNNVKDFSFFNNLTNLEEVHIRMVHIKDISAFKNFKNLQYLDADACEISDFSPLSDLTKLRYLNLDKNNFKKDSAKYFAKLVNLEVLNINNKSINYALGIYPEKIDDISPLANLTKLKEFHATGHAISDISILKNMKDLDTVYLNNNEISDFSPIENVRNVVGKDNQVVKEKSEKFTPELVEIEVEKGTQLTVEILKKAIKNLPEGSSVEIHNGIKNADTSVVGKTSQQVKITFDDNSRKFVTILINVVDKIDDEQAKDPLTIMVMKDGASFQESLSIEILDGNDVVDTVDFNQGMGLVTKYEVGKTYTVKLKGNDKYELVTGFMKVVAKDGMVGAHFLTSDDEAISDDNAVLKIKDKKSEEPGQPKKALQVMVMKDNTPVLEGLTLEIIDGDKIVDTVSVANSMAFITKYEVGKTYTLKLKDSDKYEVLTKFMKVAEESGLVMPHFLETADEETSMDNIGTIKIKDKESTEPLKPEEPAVESLEELTIKVKVDGEFKEGIQLRVNLWDALNIPSVISQPKTDANGTVVLKNLQANAKYSITVGSRGYTFKPDNIEVLTDEKGNIKSVNKKEATEYRDGIVIEGHSQASEPTKIVNVPVKTVDKETDKPVAGVEITANIINPLSSFKNFTSDEQGNVDLKLEGTQEGRVYALTVSKNDQFNWDFEPELIEVKVFEDRYEILPLKGSEVKSNIFKVTKNDRNYLRKDLKDLIEKAEALIASGKYTDESLADLKVAVQGGKAELAKAETIPYYVEGHIKNINTAIKKLAVKEQPQKPVVPDYNGGWGYYEPTPSDNYWKKPVVEAKAEPKKEEKKAEPKKEVKAEPVVITSKFTLDSMNFGVNDSNNTMDVAPFAKDGRIMVPIRFVGMALGFDVSWDDATKTAILKDDKTEIRIPMKGKTFYVNGVAYEADAEPEIRSERIFLSISNIAKALGLEEGKTIFWDQATKTASFIFNK